MEEFAEGVTRSSSGTTLTDKRYTGQYEAEAGLYFYNARFYDTELGRFAQADTIIPEAGDPLAWYRYAYVNNNPLTYSDPSGHCSLSSSSLLTPFGFLAFYGSCVQDIKDTYNAYQAGERNLGALYMEATGIKDSVVSLATDVHTINQDFSTVFSATPFIERIGPSIRLGTFSVGTAANIIGGVQVAKGIKAFTRSGLGSDKYFLEGTKMIEEFGVGDELYRVYGGASNRQGAFAFTQNPGNQISAISKGALPPGNTALSLTRISFSGTVQAEVSQVAPMFGQPGGFTQVKLPRSPFINFSIGRSLPIGIMPFVPRPY